MTSLPFYEQVLIIAICAGATILTRLLPFLIFKPGSRLPGYVNFLGKTLSSAVFALLVIYCLKDVQWTGGNYGIPEIAGLAVTTAVHLWKGRCSYPWLPVHYATWDSSSLFSFNPLINFNHSKKGDAAASPFYLVTGMGFEPILSALRTQRLNRLTNRPCACNYN